MYIRMASTSGPLQPSGKKLARCIMPLLSLGLELDFINFLDFDAWIWQAFILSSSVLCLTKLQALNGLSKRNHVQGGTSSWLDRRQIYLMIQGLMTMLSLHPLCPLINGHVSRHHWLWLTSNTYLTRFPQIVRLGVYYKPWHALVSHPLPSPESS